MARFTAALLFATLAVPAPLPAQSAPPSEAWERIREYFTPPDRFRDDLGGLRPVLKFSDGRPVTTPGEWAERRREILKAWHELMGPWPPLIQKPRMEVLEKESLEGFTRSKVSIEIAPERTVEAYLLVPAGKGPFPAVLNVYYYADVGAGLKPEQVGARDFAHGLVKRGFVGLSVGLTGGPTYYPSREAATLQPLSYLAYVAANNYNLLASLPDVDPERVGVVGHSFGGKWSMFAGALWEKFAAVCTSDPGIVFDEKRSNVNYWEPWYLGYEAGKPPRPRGVLREESPRTGPYRRMMEEGFDLHEVHALIAPRPFFVSGGAEDRAERWKALNHTVAVNRLLGKEGRVGMANRPHHPPTPEAYEQILSFFQHFLGKP
jgi:dienelactone hydrolase